ALLAAVAASARGPAPRARGPGAGSHAGDERAGQPRPPRDGQGHGASAGGEDGSHAHRADVGRVRPHRASKPLSQGAREAARIQATLRTRGSTRGGGGQEGREGGGPDGRAQAQPGRERLETADGKTPRGVTLTTSGSRPPGQ